MHALRHSRDSEDIGDLLLGEIILNLLQKVQID